MKISPIAEYLTKNKAIPKRNGNVCHFCSPEGLYLGCQVKVEQRNGTIAYVREIFGEAFKKLFYECKVIGQYCVYYRDETSPVGINIAPIKTYILTHTFNFIDNTVHSKQIEKELLNKKELIAIEKNTGTGIYNINKPFQYRQKMLLDKTENLKQNSRIAHTFH